MLAAQSKLSLSVGMALRWTRLEGAGQLGLAHERRQRLLGAAASLMRMCYRGLDGRRSGFLMLEQSPFLKCDFPSVIAICINFYIIRRFSVADDSSLLLRLMPACPPDCPFSKLEQLMPPPALPPSESDLHARLAVVHEDHRDLHPERMQRVQLVQPHSDANGTY